MQDSRFRIQEFGFLGCLIAIGQRQPQKLYGESNRHSANLLIYMPYGYWATIKQPNKSNSP